MLAAQRKDEGGRVSQSILKIVDSFVGVSQVKKPTDKFLGCFFWADILFALSCLSELLGIALEVEDYRRELFCSAERDSDSMAAAVDLGN